ncbi:hypothetical protein L226DRAFT_615235 [Lentinus tigrinus ALCF2SS1-7]|uniref:Uncharacterized protein n=1 Tax=Lentinus tigrinus ALCF2SS1-6 TaxID=1328759 RepID=A0A5C2S2L2_9APHY|nr:hypothetical protein L227DRAFT_220636 [Lentinus tigrinus ALCF2SS1-6]RPD71958.1 hypothetical protein L226DRAFT_615235 [Lentinus tigrinus ALCF2SS1-7]
MPPSRRSKGKRKDPGIDIEALARQKAKYFRIHAEESHFLASDPTARDKAIAKLYQHPEVKKGPFCVETYIGPDDDPDAFLRAVDEVFENPDRSIDQRVFRMHAAMSGLLVFNEYKIERPLEGRYDLEEKVQVCSSQIHNAWMRENLPAPQSRLNAFKAQLVRAPAQEPLTPPPSRLPSTSMKPVTPDVIDDILSKTKRDDLLKMKFVLDADAPDSETGGPWEVESYCTKRSGEVVYNVLFEDLDDPIPHDEAGMRHLLRDSHVAL